MKETIPVDMMFLNVGYWWQECAVMGYVEK
jgi:hypothetical protein